MFSRAVGMPRLRLSALLCTAPPAAGKQLPRKSAATVVKKTPTGLLVTMGVLGVGAAGLGYTLYGTQPLTTGRTTCTDAQFTSG